MDPSVNVDPGTRTYERGVHFILQRTGISRFRRILPVPYLAIDLGTANTRVYVLGKGLIADEPTNVQLKPYEDEISGGIWDGGAGDDTLVFPMRSGVVINIEAAATLLKPLIRRARRFGMVQPRGIVCVPTDACQSERDALVEAVQRSGVFVLTVAPEPLAAAVGSGLVVESPFAQMLVDIGSGVTDIAVIRSGRIIYSRAIRTACSYLQSAINHEVAIRYEVQLHPRESERLAREAGAKLEASADRFHIAGGVDAGGRPASVRLHHGELREIMDPIIDSLVNEIFIALRDMPSIAAAEVIEDCIWLTGGGACMHGMAERIAEFTTLKARLVPDPMHAVVNGAAQMLSAKVYA